MAGDAEHPTEESVVLPGDLAEGGLGGRPTFTAMEHDAGNQGSVNVVFAGGEGMSVGKDGGK